MNSCNTDIFFRNYYHLQSVRFEFNHPIRMASGPIYIINSVIIYMKKLLNIDWLRKVSKMCNTRAKCVIQCKLHIEILDYDWLMNNRVWSGPMKSFVFKSSLAQFLSLIHI